ncbi:MAG: hypothetical protein J6U25_02485 [Clostridia bacterium]|nr:hypothetical protein [Clostridia bacterium]
MKKFLTILSVMTLTLVLAACSAAVVSPYTRSGFLSDPSIKTVSQVS